MRRHSRQSRFTLDRFTRMRRTAAGARPRRDAQRRTKRKLHKLDHRVDVITLAQLVAEYEAGASSRQLENHFGISRASIVKMLREAGVAIRNQGLSAQQINEATRLYADGWSLARIGAQLGVDAGTVWRRLRERGIVMRDSQGRTR